ncbi:MAG: tRNA pseudouridine(55) synthase TruB [Acidobacteria bacterium]|nr:tRNA pseudouridine(55) synthase TruB [Acidobacteriota bacterium]
MRSADTRDVAAARAGVLVIDKPSGPTSHDIVAVARRALGERRIGHCGTLDPMATGVLALAVGPATRLVQFMAGADKFYTARIRFGVSTRTYDTSGEVTATSPLRPERAAVEAALDRFRGTFDQIPPAFSAKKIDGHRAYDLARQTGAPAPVLDPVRVQVAALDLVAFDDDHATLTMQVSAGFYVRSLAHDLGQHLGMGAALEALRRTRSGDFTLDDAVTVDVLASAPREVLWDRVIPMARLLPAVPVVTLDAAAAERARRGVDLPCPPDWSAAPELTRLLDDQGRLLGLAVPASRAGFLHPSVVLG